MAEQEAVEGEVKASKYKVIKEVAEQEFESWAEAWEIDTDQDDFDEDELASFKSLKKKIVKAIMLGRAVVLNDGEEIQYTLKNARGEISQFLLVMPLGNAYTAMDKHKAAEYNKKQNQYIAAMIKQPPALLTKLSGIDLKFLQAVSSLFLAS